MASEEIENISDNLLSNIFNLGSPAFLISKYMLEQEREQEELSRTEFERKAYDLIIKELKSDLERLGLPLTFSTRILLSELALNLILLSRAKFFIVHRDIIQYQPTKQTIHPLHGDFIFRLQKVVNQQLGLLGLLPAQQLERQKVQFVQKIKKKLMEINTSDGSVELEMTSEQKC